MPGFDGTTDPDCVLDIATGTFTPVVKWDVPVFGGPAGDYVGLSDVLVASSPTVELYAVEGGVRTLLASEPLGVDVPAGRYEDSAVFVVEDPHPERWDSLVAVVTTTATECDTSNNEIELPGPFCR